MSSASSNVSRKKGKRGITRRVRDEHGNIRVIKYARKGSRFNIPGLTWGKVPSLLVGIPLASYSALIYADRKDNLSENTLGKAIVDIPDGLDAAVRLIIAGTMGMVLAGFLGYSMVRKGFKFRKYPAVSREIVAIWASVIILTAIISPFINEPGLIRQQSDDEFVTNTNDYDVSGLDSPFYSEFLNGLLDLLGNIPEPKEQVAFITPNDGGTFDPDKDRYLYRWRVAETYDPGLADFDQGYTSTQLEYVDSTTKYNSLNLASDEGRSLRIKEQYLTISNAYIGDALVPWNSQYGGMIGGLDSVVADVDDGFTGELVNTSVGGYRDINEQPALSMAFTDSRTTGFVEYDSFFVKDDKEFIADNAVAMSQLSTELGKYKQDAETLARFGDLSQANTNEISGIWGVNSLPGGTSYFGGANANDDAFVNKYNEYKAILDSNPSISVYDFTLLIYNDVQNAVIQGLLDGSLNIDPTQTSGVADPGLDKAYWFYNALVDPTVQYGMKELLAGFVNMLRSFDIAARPIIGFSIGSFLKDGVDCPDSDCDTISILFENIHVWLEVLIPVNDGGNTDYRWGIFNPVPDPWVLQNDASDFAFGVNSLGGTPNIEVQVTSGDDSVLGAALDLGPLGTQSNFKTNKKGKDFEGRVRITYDGTPSFGQTIQLRLLTESDLLSGNLDPSTGIELPSVVTDGADGWGNFKLFVDSTGLVYTYNGNIRNTTAIPGLNIVDVDPLQSQGSTGVYGIIAVYSLSFNGTITGWQLPANLTLTANVSSTLMTNPNTGGNIISYGVLFDTTVQFTVKVIDPDTSDPIEGVSNIDFLLLNENDYNTLVTSLALGILEPTLISQNRIGNFTITDSAGNGTIEVTFDQAFENNRPSNQLYVALALIQAGFKYNDDPVFVWFERNLSMNSTLYDSGVEIPDDGNTGLTVGSPSASWVMITNLTAFDNPGNQIFSPEPAVGANLQYYIIKQSEYNTYVFGINPTVDFNNLNTNVLSSCSETPTVGDSCYKLIVGGPTILGGITLTGDIVTQSNGLANVTFDLVNTAFASDYYYIVAVAGDFASFARSSLFFSSAPPGGLALNSINENNLEAKLGENTESIGLDQFGQINIVTLSIFSVLSLLMVVLTYNLTRRFVQ